MGCEFEAAPIGTDCFVEPPGGFQCVPVTHPEFWLTRVLAQHVGIDADCAWQVAEPRGERRREIAIAGVSAVRGQEELDLGDRRRELRLLLQDDSEVVPGGEEARREFEAAGKQLLRVAVTADSRTHFSEHANRRHVGRVLFQVIA